MIGCFAFPVRFRRTARKFGLIGLDQSGGGRVLQATIQNPVKEAPILFICRSGNFFIHSDELFRAIANSPDQRLATLIGIFCGLVTTYPKAPSG